MVRSKKSKDAADQPACRSATGRMKPERRRSLGRLLPQDGAAALHCHPGERLLLRWSGTVLPRVWRTCVATLLAATVACFVYDPVRRAVKYQRPHPAAASDDQELLHFLFNDFEKVWQYLTVLLTLPLGFFNFTAYNRWWAVRERCGTLSASACDMAAVVAAYYVTPASPSEIGSAAGLAELRRVRREIVRVLGLSVSLFFQEAHGDHCDVRGLVQRGLLQEGSEEWREVEAHAWGYREAVARAAFLAGDAACARRCVPEINAANAVNQFDVQRFKFTAAASDISVLVSQSIPSAFCHLLEVLVTVHVILTPLALVPLVLWVAPLVAPCVTFFCYGTYVLTTEILADPFAGAYGIETGRIVSDCLEAMDRTEAAVPGRDFWSVKSREAVGDRARPQKRNDQSK